MDFINDLMKPLAVIACVAVGYILFARSKFVQVKKNGHYTVPDWNFFIKKWWAERRVRQLVNMQNSNTSATEISPLVEEPQILHQENSSDSQLIYGADTVGNSLLIKLTRRRHRIAELWLILTLKNGNVFTLPNHPDTRIVNATSRKFQAGGLTMECLKEFNKWRVTYAGNLRKGVKQTLDQHNLDSNDLVFVKFNFLWTAACDPLHFPHSWSPKLIAQSLATESWLDGNWFNMLTKRDAGGYDQYGALLGQVFFGIDSNMSLECFDLNLPGLRQRRWGPHKVTHLHRTASVVGVCHDGSVFLLGAISSKRGLSHSQFGSLRCPNGDVFAIDWTDFHLSNIAESLDNIPKILSIRFVAGRKEYTTILHFDHDNLLPLTGGRPLDWEALNIPFQSTLNDRHGAGVALLWYPLDGIRKCPLRDPPISERLVYSTVLPSEKEFILPFCERSAANVASAGGKGASLALLFSIESAAFSVPNGFILSVHAFEDHIRSSAAIAHAIQTVENICYQKEAESLKEACLNASQLIANSTLSSEIYSEISRGYDMLLSKHRTQSSDGFEIIDDKQTRVAVRSSAIGEDGSASSSAGQNSTFLSVSGTQNIVEAIKKCWASLYTFQSVEYRRQTIQPISTRMAVVVQEMAAADCAGVLFTCHPKSNDPNQIMITSNFGLGESVVSGSINPDVYTFTKNLKRCVELESVTTSRKTHGFYSNSTEQGIVSLEMREQKQHEESLTADQALRLARIGVMLEEMYGCPQDVEWAIVADHIFLLQSRPITLVGAFSDWELLHEFDFATMSSEDLCTIANVGEVLPGVTTPLTQSLLGESLDIVLSEDVSGKKAPKYFRSIILSTHHQITMAVYKTFFSFPEPTVSIANKVHAIAVFGHDFITDCIHATALHRNSVLNFFKKIGMFTWVGKNLFMNNKRVREAQEFNSNFVGYYSLPGALNNFKNSQDLFDDIKAQRKNLIFINKRHSHASQASVLYQLITVMMLLEGREDDLYTTYGDLGVILRSGKANESAEIPNILKDIADLIYMSGRSKEFSELSPSEGLDWLSTYAKDASMVFKRFLDHHYHRTLKEFDLASITWGMRPETVIEMVQVCLRDTEDYRPAYGRSVPIDDADVIASLQTPKKPLTKSLLRFIVPACRKAVNQREITKSCLIAFIHEFRIAFRQLGVLMVQEGLLPESELIFFVTLEEIQQILSTRNVTLIRKATRRRRMFTEWEKIRLPELCFGVPTPVTSIAATPKVGKLVVGTPVCGGIITGRACVLKSFTEVSKIQRGDILVTHSTDIGWSPYFPILGGIVTELGGIISHGAVVAREYGLPCIVGAQGATDILQFGDQVQLDANEGHIGVIEMKTV